MQSRFAEVYKFSEALAITGIGWHDNFSTDTAIGSRPASSFLVVNEQSRSEAELAGTLLTQNGQPS
jgi:hypothetical protein